MAQLPSLALGLGLQGKPIDRAALNLRRAEGEERAALRAQQKAQKELDPIKKRLMDIGGKAYIPVQRQILADKQAKALKYMFDNGEDVDRMQLSQMVNDVVNYQAIAERDSKMYQKFATDKNYSHLNNDLKDLNTITDVETFNSSLGNRAGFNAQINEEGGIVWGVYNRMPTETVVSDYIKSLGDGAFESIESASTATVGGQKQIIRKPIEGLFDRAYGVAVNNPDTYRTESAQLQDELIQSGRMPDLSDPKGKASFDTLVKERIAQKTQSAMDFEKSKGVGRGMNLTINTGDKITEKGEILGGYDNEIPIKFNNKDLSVKSYESNNIGNQTISMPPTKDTRYADGRPYDLNSEITYSQVGISYLTKSPVKIKPPKDFTILNWGTKEQREALAGYQTPSGEYNLPKGFAIPSELQQFVVDSGADLEAKIVAWGIDENGQIVYRDAEPIMQSAFFRENNQDKNYLQSVKRRQMELQKEVEKNKPKRTQSSMPRQEPVNKQEPVKSSVPSRWEQNKR